MMKTLAAVDMAAYAIPSDDNVIVAVFTEETGLVCVCVCMCVCVCVCVCEYLHLSHTYTHT